MKRNMTARMSMVLLATACLMMAISVAAQSGRRANSPGQFGMPGISGVDLTDGQKASISTIRQNEQQQIEAIRNNTTLSPEEKRSQIESVRQNSHQQAQSVLTPEQRQTLDDRRANMGQPGVRPNFGGDLGLSDDQKDQLKTIRKNEQDQIQTIRNDSTLSNEEKRAKVESIRQNSREQTQGVLTPDQQQQIANRRANAPNGGQRPAGQSGGIGDGQRRPGGGGTIGNGQRRPAGFPGGGGGVPGGGGRRGGGRP